MTTTAPVSVEAMRNLGLWVPKNLREAAWRHAYQTYLDRASTTDGSGKFYAKERADRYWPNYIGNGDLK